MEFGDIYVTIYPSGEKFINLYEGIDDHVVKFISVNDNFYFNTLASCENSKIEKASLLEKKWLLECIKQDRFIPLKDIKAFSFGR